MQAAHPNVMKPQILVPTVETPVLGRLEKEIQTKGHSPQMRPALQTCLWLLFEDQRPPSRIGELSQMFGVLVCIRYRKSSFQACEITDYGLSNHGMIMKPGIIRTELTDERVQICKPPQLCFI